MIPTAAKDVSELEVSLINKKSILTTSKIYKPLKVFTLYNQHVCHIVFSNYGGGFVSGDQVLLNLILRSGTNTVFSNQANTRIYKSASQESSSQQIKATLENGSFAVYLSDPIIAHKGSIFEQINRWDIGEDAVLLALDWFEAGRLLNNERFEFDSFFSEMKVDINGKPVVWDKFKMVPDDIDPDSPGVFLDHSCYLNIFLIGNENTIKVKMLEEALTAICSRHFFEETPQLVRKAGILGTVVKISNQAFVVRCSARSHDMVAAIVKELSAILTHQELLGFNPAERKF